jgi:hypothetical protein
VSRLVRENLTQRALKFNLVLDDVSITHVAFSPEFTHAVEAKQVSLQQHLLFETLSQCFILKVAQQTALRAAFLVDQAIQEKQVLMALGTADTYHTDPIYPGSQSLFELPEKLEVLS